MKELVKKLKKVLAGNKLILDIIIFGSYVKGNLNFNDIDIAVLLNNKKDINWIGLKKEINEKNADIQLVSFEDYDKFLWITLIREGFSVKNNKYLNQIYGIKPVVLYKYSLKKLGTSKKVMFERGIKNFKNIKKLSNSVVLVPIEHSGEFKDFLKNWDLDIDTLEYGLLPFTRKEII